jgi:GNAT superfamily N-acetyltransferase
MVRIREARAGDLPALQLIEAAAVDLFRDVGMAALADLPPPPVEVLAAYQRAARAWVADDDGPVAFAVADVVDRCAYVTQLSVDPRHSRRGVGAMLLDHIERWATVRELQALTLRTFRSVPWNAPYYARRGFRELTDAELTPGLVAIAETAAGLDPADRVCMRRDPSLTRVRPAG